MPKSKKEETNVVATDPTPSTPVVESSKKQKKKKKKDLTTTPDTNITTGDTVTPVTETPVVNTTPNDVTPVTKTKRSKKKELPVETEQKTNDDSLAQMESSTELSTNGNDNSVELILSGLISTVQERLTFDKQLLSSLRELNKHILRERRETERSLKKMSKGGRKKKSGGGNKSPGGFTKPTLLSPPMCSFLSVPEGTELPRTDVTRRINQYIKTNNLQNPDNKKQILADTSLSKLLFLKETDELTYFNLQRFMKSHFLKRDAETGVYSTFTPPV